jgi:putative transposase
MDKPQVYNKNKPQRKKGYDYNLPGAYFVTICLENRRSLFGKIVNETCELSQTGIIANKCWQAIPEHFKNVELGEYVVMPNHFHGIIFVYDENTVGQTHAFDYKQAESELSIDDKKKEHVNKMHKKLSIIVGSFKSAVTKESNRLNPEINFAWQTSFYDHIVRDDEGLEYISDYIRRNPENWKKDLENEKYLSEITDNERSIQLKDHYGKLLRSKACP